ncbi:hypothetical protein [Flavobacterium sp. I3-2]|uniref:hypothetical protein n=1 Tax=Flavobacterium sp. I3-2 TaxID=2748319 RepID=UPI0015A9594D|nr:hypothetical protein [Flavobacterium sp. I3-2]
MKKITFILSTLTLLSFSDSFAQVSAQGVSGRGTLTFYRSNSDNKPSVIGSEYIIEEYKSAKVNQGNQSFQIRFNAHNNVMEYKKDDENLILIKKDNTFIEFSDGRSYELISYTDKKGKTFDSYLYLIKNAGKISIYKYEKINYVEARPAVNTYDTGSPAEYKRASDSFYIKVGDKVSELPTKQKDYIKMFPGKESEIKEYFKSNKINFKDNADLTKLAMFLNSIS